MGGVDRGLGYGENSKRGATHHPWPMIRLRARPGRRMQSASDRRRKRAWRQQSRPPCRQRRIPCPGATGSLRAPKKSLRGSGGNITRLRATRRNYCTNRRPEASNEPGIQKVPCQIPYRQGIRGCRSPLRGCRSPRRAETGPSRVHLPHASFAISRSLNFWILPVEVFGSSVNTT